MSNSRTSRKSAQSSQQMPLNFDQPKAGDPMFQLTQILLGEKPAYLPPEPTVRTRGWGGKSILEDE